MNETNPPLPPKDPIHLDRFIPLKDWPKYYTAPTVEEFNELLKKEEDISSFIFDIEGRLCIKEAAFLEWAQKQLQYAARIKYLHHKQDVLPSD